MTSALNAIRVKPEGWTSDEWETPPELVRELAEKFGFKTFDLDPCCTEANKKAWRGFSKPHGLIWPWEGRVFCNPPYSDISPWLRKALNETTNSAEIIVVLLPAATDTAWFHDFVLPYAELHFLRGRVRFLGWQGTPIPAPRNPSFVAVYKAALTGLLLR